MSCLDGCCDEHGGELGTTLTPACPELPDVEVPVAESEANGSIGLGGMVAIPSLKSSSEELTGGVEHVISHILSHTSHVSLHETVRTTDWDVMRGITLRASLRRGGSLWRSNPTYLAPERRAALFDKSRHMEQLDIFISHSWASGGLPKALSLFLQSGCNFALVCWFFGLVLAAAMCHADLLPLPWTYAANHIKFSEICPYGPWAMIFGFFGTWIGLVLSPYSPRCKPRDMCFIDFACVHQTDESLMKRGIRSIAGFLSVSKELRILWSPVYLTRLWCVFEVATYKKLNPNGKVVVAPIFLETILIILHSTMVLVTFAYAFQRQAGSDIAKTALILSCAPFLISIHWLRKSYAQKHELFSQFENFDLDAVDCLCDSDRDFIYSAISELYGSNEAFTSYVRGALQEELLGPMTRSLGPRKYALLIASPGVSMHMDFISALWKGGSPAEVIMIYVVALVLVGNGIFLKSALNLVVLLCDHFAEPVLPSLDWLQTCLIFVVFGLYFVSGAWLCQQAYWTHAWELLPGIAVAYALVILALHWLQRKCEARRFMTSKTRTAVS